MFRILIILFAWISLNGAGLAERCSEKFCGSRKKHPKICEVGEAIQSLSILKKISKHPCVAKESFDYIDNKIHVNNGCRANFKVCYQNPEDESSTNYAVYVIVPVVISVIVAVTVAILLIRRRRRRHEVGEPKRKKTESIAIANKAYIGNRIDGNPFSQCSDSNRDSSIDNEYNYVQSDEFQREGCEEYSYSNTTNINEERIQSHNKNYSHLSPQKLPFFENNYSRLTEDASNLDFNVTDNTYSYLSADGTHNEKKVEIKQKDPTYNLLMSKGNISKTMKNIHDRFYTDDSTEYSHAVSGGRGKKPESGDYSHLGKMYPQTNFRPVCRLGITDDYEQAISSGTGLRPDCLENSSQTPGVFFVHTRSNECADDTTYSEANHEYYVLEKNRP